MAFDISTLMLQWEQIGVFSFLLPFLLIFAIVYGILSVTNIFGENKGIHLVIALVIGLMALQMPFVSDFYREIFPRLGVGLAVVLTLFIMIGLFIPQDESKFWFYGLGAIALIIAMVVISQSFENFGWFSGYWDRYAFWIITTILTVVLLLVVVFGGPRKGGGGKPWDKEFKPWVRGH